MKARLQRIQSITIIITFLWRGLRNVRVICIEVNFCEFVACRAITLVEIFDMTVTI